MARSGTTWLAKIFDSHPDVLYSHEPDLNRHAPPLPSLTLGTLSEREIDAARRAVMTQIGLRTVKSGCSLPVFPKSGESALRLLCRRSGALAMKALYRVAPRSQRDRLSLPRWLDQRVDGRHVVMKTVSGIGRANLLAAALPEARFVFILRDPFGQVASRLLGLRQGFLSTMPRETLLRTPLALTYGLTSDRYAALSLAERLAWEWALVNEKALHDIGDLPQTRVVRYDEITAAPEAAARLLLAFAGLDWHPSVARFVHRSRSFTGRDRYYSVMKGGHAAGTKWQTYLTAAEQEQVRTVMRRTRVGRLWPEI